MLFLMKTFIRFTKQVNNVMRGRLENIYSFEFQDSCTKMRLVFDLKKKPSPTFSNTKVAQI